jgi:hypothetical protein
MDRVMSGRTASKRGLWTLWVPLGLAALIFLLITIIGNVLVIGSKLGTYHPVVERVFYVGLALVLVWLIATPLVGVLSAPVLDLEDVVAGKSKANYKTLRRISRQLIRSESLSVEQRAELAGAVGLGSDLCQPLATAINAQKGSATQIIRNHAVLVFVSTAVSQNGRLDAVTILATNFRLVRTLVGHFGYRPPLKSLIKIYAEIFLVALVADELDDLDLEGVFSLLGLGVLGAIPGISLVANSVLDGTINALLTLRVGFVTQKCLLNAGCVLTRTEIRKEANREARQELKGVWRDAAPILPGLAKQVVERWI